MWKKLIPCYFEAQPNYGDLLTAHILDHFASQIDPQLQVKCVPVRDAQVVGIGSILSNVPSTFTGLIWSTGTARPSETQPCPQAQIVAIRGEHSLAAISRDLTPEVVMGDGGLLISEVFPEPVPQKFKLGIIPHVVDDATVRQFKWTQSSDICVIDLRHPVEQVTRQIKQCRMIVSSSLHGLIVADAFQIPNHRFRVATSAAIIGGHFKYDDYYSAFQLPHQPCLNLTAQTTVASLEGFFEQNPYARPHLQDIQHRLRQATVNMLQSLSCSLSLQLVLPPVVPKRPLQRGGRRRHLSRPRPRPRR